MLLYHPGLDRTCVVADGPAGEAQAAVMAESGWSKTVPAEHTDPALAPDQPGVVYRPVTPDAKPAKRSTSKSTES